MEAQIRHVIKATAVSIQATSDANYALATIAQAEADSIQTIQYGETVTEVRTNMEPDLWQFSARAGDQISIYLEQDSEDPNTELMIANEKNEFLAVEKHIGEDETLLFNVELPADGGYWIFIHDFRYSDDVYSLRVTAE